MIGSIARPLNEYPCLRCRKLDIVGLPYSQLPHPWIQPTTDQKYLKKNFQKVPRKQNLNFLYVDSYFREGNSTPLQHSCLENPMDRGAWWAAVHGVSKSRTGLSDFTFTFHFHALEKEMATHSSVLAWRIPGMGEPGGLPSVGSHRAGHD